MKTLVQLEAECLSREYQKDDVDAWYAALPEHRRTYVDKIVTKMQHDRPETSRHKVLSLLMIEELATQQLMGYDKHWCWEIIRILEEKNRTTRTEQEIVIWLESLLPEMRDNVFAKIRPLRRKLGLSAIDILSSLLNSLADRIEAQAYHGVARGDTIHEMIDEVVDTVLPEEEIQAWLNSLPGGQRVALLRELGKLRARGVDIMKVLSGIIIQQRANAESRGTVTLVDIINSWMRSSEVLALEKLAG